MKLINRYYFYILNRLGILFPIWIVCFIFNLKYIAFIGFIYAIAGSIYYFISHRDFVIDSNKITLISSKTENYYFNEIVKIIFIDKYFLFFSIQKIKIEFSDGSKKIINCDGLNSDDECVDSFYEAYQYLKSLFKNTVISSR